MTVRVNKELPVDALALHPIIQQFRHQEYPRQREANIQRIVDNYDPLLMDRLVAVPRDDGGFWVIRGGHRLEALRRLGQSSAPCEVITGLNGDGLRRQVEIVLASESGRQWTVLNKFLIAIKAGIDPEASIERILNSHGSRVVSGGSGNGYACVNVLKAVYRWDALDTAVDIIESAWDKDNSARSGIMVKAVAGIHRFYSIQEPTPDYAVARFIEKLSRRNPQKLTLDAQNRSRALHDSAAAALARNLVEVYNHGRRSPLPEFKPGKGLRG